VLPGLMKQAPTTSRCASPDPWVCPPHVQTSWAWHCGSPRNLASSVMCFWRRPEQDSSADMCCCRHAGMVCAPTHRCFLTEPGLAPCCWQRFRPRAVRDGTSWPTPGTGPWLPFATLEITQTTCRGHDVDLSFDPVLNVVPGLETYDWLLNYAGSLTPPLAERASTGRSTHVSVEIDFWSGTSPRSTLNTAAMLQQEPSTNTGGPPRRQMYGIASGCWPCLLWPLGPPRHGFGVAHKSRPAAARPNLTANPVVDESADRPAYRQRNVAAVVR
jgi:hypothetical protein